MMDDNILEECFDSLALEARELYLDSEVPVLNHIPTALEFYREWVCPNKPVIIRGAIDNWPALQKWTHDYLRSEIGSEEVTVAVTPNGYADAVYQGKFLMPEERVMTFGKFLDIMEGKVKANGIFYVQKQNSNFTDEFLSLMKDAEEEIPWASEAFGCSPDAVNFWIGDHRAVTSMHKDHYENLYCVVSGSKTFTLLPPTDQPFIPYEKYKPAYFKESDTGEFSVVEADSMDEVPWIAVDPLNPDLSRYPTYAKARPITVTVDAGEALYLPSLWFHHVQQSHACIAVNFWYDMKYDIKYNYFKFVEQLQSNRPNS